MKGFRYITICLAVLLYTRVSCAQEKVQVSYVPELSFSDLNTYYPIEQHPQFGGFSGLQFDDIANKWYLITDGRPPLRTSYLYQFEATASGFPNWIATPKIATIDSLAGAESLRISADRKHWIIASEGDDEDNLATGDLHLVDFERQSLVGSHSIITKYPANRGLEAIAVAPSNTIWTMSEWPSFEDKEFIRIRSYHLDTKSIGRQYSYTINVESCMTDNRKTGASLGNGVSEMVMENDSICWTVERCFNGKLTSIVLKRVLLPTSSTDDTKTLQAAKVLQEVDVNALIGTTPDNIEGLTFGPTLPDGSKTLCMIADDNFSRVKNGKQKTVFIVLKVAPSLH